MNDAVEFILHQNARIRELEAKVAELARDKAAPYVERERQRLADLYNSTPNRPAIEVYPAPEDGWLLRRANTTPSEKGTTMHEELIGRLLKADCGAEDPSLLSDVVDTLRQNARARAEIADDIQRLLNNTDLDRGTVRSRLHEIAVSAREGRKILRARVRHCIGWTCAYCDKEHVCNAADVLRCDNCGARYLSEVPSAD